MTNHYYLYLLTNDIDSIKIGVTEQLNFRLQGINQHQSNKFRILLALRFEEKVPLYSTRLDHEHYVSQKSIPKWTQPDKVARKWESFFKKKFSDKVVLGCEFFKLESSSINYISRIFDKLVQSETSAFICVSKIIM